MNINNTIKYLSFKEDGLIDAISDAFAEFAKTVRTYDSHRMIITGNSLPRPSAYHDDGQDDEPCTCGGLCACGEPAEVRYIWNHGWHVQCKGQRCWQGPAKPTREEAVAAWQAVMNEG